MNNKNLPIQFVETRGERDWFLKEGMGDNSLPAWSTEESLIEHVGIMENTFSDVDRIFDAREEEGLPILMVATLDKRAVKRKAYRANARSIFDSRNKRNVIGKNSHQGLLVKVDCKNDLQMMRYNITGENISQDKRCGIAVIENLQLYHPYIEDDIIGRRVKVRLVDYQNQQLNELANHKMCQVFERCNVNAHSLDYCPGLNLYVIENANQEVIEALATMDSVISVKKMPYFELTVSPEEFNTEIEVSRPVDGESYPRIGLLDSGVETIPHLAPWIESEENIAGLEEDDIRRLHGTSVASIINYGDALENKVLTGTAPMYIRSCIVNTDDRVIRISEDEMVEHIKTAISNNRDIDIWNLSQGSSCEIEDDEFSEFAMVLDNIQKENNILICKSAGNIDPRFPDQKRITQGAESLLSLTVGSVAHVCESEEDVPVGGRSHFSRVGPGPGGAVKPDLVHVGGNKSIGVNSFSDTGFQSNAYRGTSFSTPRVTALAANLAHRMNRNFDPLLIKALLIHSAKYHYLTTDDNNIILRELGFGIPATLEDILYNDPDEFTMVWKPELSDGVDMQIQDIPFPANLVNNGHFIGEVTVTVVTNPVLRESEKSEYCQSDVKVALQWYDRIDYVVLGAAGTPRTYRNSERLVNPKNILTKDLYKASSFRSTNPIERTVICGEEYLAVKNYHVNLEQMRSANRNSYLKENRRWCLSIVATNRDATMVDKMNGLDVGTTEVVVIITIKDPMRTGVVYNACLQALDKHNFAHSDIVIRQNINVVNE